MNYCGKYICARWDEDVVVRKLSQSNKDQEYIACLLCDMTELNGKKLVTCGSCKTARYCNKVCQRKHWKQHKPGCTGYMYKKKSKKKTSLNVPSSKQGIN